MSQLDNSPRRAYFGVSEEIFPVIYQIEPTSRCNLSCAFCDNKSISRKRDIDFSLFESIIDQITPYAKLIKLNLMGEPLLNRDIFNMIALSKKRTSAKVVMFTNAVSLSRSSFVEITRSGLDEIVFSVTNENAGTKALDNIVEFLMYKNGRGCSVTINCVGDPSEQIKTFLNSIRSYEKCKSYLSPIMDMGQGGDSAVVGCFEQKKRMKSEGRQPCAMLWYSMVVQSDGNVIKCCKGYGRSSETIGNLLAQSVEEIWNGRAATSVRRKHKDGKFDDCGVCESCSDWLVPSETEEWIKTTSPLSAMRP